MKIAVSGAHRTGKSTLVAELCSVLPGYSCYGEPYHLLEEEGHIFPELPGLEDFELQLDYSIELISSSDDNVIFDRCPVDFLAYMMTYADFDDYDLQAWLPKVLNALEQLDLLVLVPIEEPDLIVCPEWEDPELRIRVNDELYSLILGDIGDFHVPVVTVNGAVSERVHQVLENM